MSESKHVFRLAIVLIAAVALLVGVVLVGAAPNDTALSRTDNIQLEHDIAWTTSMSTLDKAMSEGGRNSILAAQLDFSVHLLPEQVVMLARDHNLRIDQMQYRLEGIDEALTGGYVVQPNESLEASLQNFNSLQDVFFRNKLQSVQSALDSEEDPEKLAARQRQLENLKAHARAFDQEGLRIATLLVHATVGDLHELATSESSLASFVVSERK